MTVKALFARKSEAVADALNNKKRRKDLEKRRHDVLIARYARGSVALQREGGYMLKEDKEELKARILRHKFN